MLCIKRKKGESLLIGGVVTVQILRVTGRDVMLGVTAPASIPILRPEAKDKKPKTRRENDHE